MVEALEFFKELTRSPRFKWPAVLSSTFIMRWKEVEGEWPHG